MSRKKKTNFVVILGIIVVVSIVLYQSELSKKVPTEYGIVKCTVCWNYHRTAFESCPIQGAQMWVSGGGHFCFGGLGSPYGELRVCDPIYPDWKRVCNSPPCPYCQVPSTLCGDHICEGTETKENCVKDCILSDEFMRENMEILIALVNKLNITITPKP